MGEVVETQFRELTSTEKHMASYAERICRNAKPTRERRKSEQKAKPQPTQKPWTLSKAEENRAESVIFSAVKGAMAKLAPHDFRVSGRVGETIQKAIYAQCAAIVRAAKLKPEEFNAKARLSDKRKEARKALADELRSSRRKLSRLKSMIIWAEREADLVIAQKLKEKRKEMASRLHVSRDSLRKLRSAIKAESRAAAEVAMASYGHSYPPVPPPELAPTKMGDGLPDHPGIYFLWEGETIDYVGQSICLCGRLKLGSHHVMQPHHRISYVYCERHALSWTECHYIGLAKPKKNFGKAASHNKECSR